MPEKQWDGEEEMEACIEKKWGPESWDGGWKTLEGGAKNTWSDLWRKAPISEGTFLVWNPSSRTQQTSLCLPVFPVLDSLAHSKSLAFRPQNFT